MTSKFSIENRELLQKISCGEAVVGIDFGNLIVRELAAFRLAAMDSEPVEMPLDYLQGHKDGLEWAARLAEANHPETGDWLYDDPIELAKAIRKGPDMPPAQPVADSEPVAVIDLANLDYLLSGADADVWPPEREEMGDVLLYRHPQPAPAVQCPFPCGWDNLNKLAIQDAAFVTLALVAGEPATESIRQAAISNNDRLLKVISACRAAMMQESQKSAGASNNCRSSENVQVMQVMQDVSRCSTKSAPALDSPPKTAESRVGNSPVIPDRWIPVSERIPAYGGSEQRYVLAADFRNYYSPNIPNTQVGVYGDWFNDGNPTWDDGDGEDLHLKEVTHWMPLPAAPQEVKSES
ncbi:DUF551 domain-containing protein [Klebsiella pneumoniae]|uniref:DUF551 domain-containing protein n=1 Tax=Klebsiella pneumoniae TaxID=573 RepID=UPI003D7E9985